MKVVGQLCCHYVLVVKLQSLLHSAYSETAAVTPCSRRSKYVNRELGKMNKDLDIYVPNYSYTTSTALCTKIAKKL